MKTKWLQKLSSHFLIVSMVVSMLSSTALAANMSGSTIVLSNLNVGGNTNATVTFTAVTNIPSDGKVKITFPNGFDISTIQSSDISSTLDGTFTALPGGQTLTITRAGGTDQSGTKTININNNKIKNPATAGLKANYNITTTDKDDAVIDSDMSIPGSTIVAVVGALSNASVIPTLLTASANSNVTIAFTAQNNIPADGKIKITFPAGFDISNVVSADISSTLDGSFTTSLNGLILTITRSGAATAQGGARTITIGNNKVKNPSSAGATGTYTITTTTATETTIDTNVAVAGNTITASVGTLTNASVTPASLNTSANSNVVIAFTAANNIPADGKIKITFPAGFDISNVVSADIASTLDGSFTTNLNGLTLTITRSGAATAQGGARTITIGNNKVKNPSSAGITGSYTITTTTNNDTVIDSNASVNGSTMVAVSSLTNTSVTPASLNVSALSNITIAFTTTNNIPANGKIKITFPAGFDIANIQSADITSTLDGSFTTSISNQTLTITRSGTSTAQGGARTITIGNNKVKNPSTAGLTGTYTISTTNNNDTVIDTNASVSGITLTATGALTSVAIVPSSLSAAANSNIAISFTATNNIPANGKIKITFPAGFDISNIQSADISSTLNGSFTASVSGQILTITRTGSGTAQSGTKTITIGNSKVKNPLAAGITGTYSMITTNAADSTIDSVASIPGDTITAASTLCAGYKDVQANDTDCEAYKYVQSIGAITGNADNTLNAAGTLQRDQVAKIVLETFKNFDKNADYCKNVNPFPDVTTTSWSFQYVCKGVQDKIITGYLTGEDKGFYRPSRSVNRAEFAALLLRNMKNETLPAISSTSYSDVPANSWYSGYAKYFKDKDLISGTNFLSAQTVSRREVAQIIYKLHQLGKI